MSVGLVGQLSLNVSKATGQEINYVACFVPPRKTSSDFPKILVQLQPWPEPPTSYEQLEDVLRNALPDALKTTAARLPVSLESLTEDGHFLDRDKNRLVLRLRASIPGDGTVDAISFGMLGDKGTVFLHCYSRPSRYAETLPLFERFADSFKFDEGRSFSPKPSAGSADAALPAGGARLSGSARSGAVGVLVSAAVGAGFLVLRVLRRGS